MKILEPTILIGTFLPTIDADRRDNDGGDDNDGGYGEIDGGDVLGTVMDQTTR